MRIFYTILLAITFPALAVETYIDPQALKKLALLDQIEIDLAAVEAESLPTAEEVRVLGLKTVWVWDITSYKKKYRYSEVLKEEVPDGWEEIRTRKNVGLRSLSVSETFKEEASEPRLVYTTSPEYHTTLPKGKITNDHEDCLKISAQAAEKVFESTAQRDKLKRLLVGRITRVLMDNSTETRHKNSTSPKIGLFAGAKSFTLNLASYIQPDGKCSAVSEGDLREGLDSLLGNKAFQQAHQAGRKRLEILIQTGEKKSPVLNLYDFTDPAN